MNKIKQILIGAGALVLSTNAAAIFINEDGSETMEYADYAHLIQDIINDVYSETDKDVRRAARIARKQARRDNKLAKLASGDFSNKRERRVNRRVSRLESQIARIATKIGVTITTSDILADNGGEGCGEGQCGNHNVPEPSTIALLGLGLVGIGVARRMRKKA